MGNEAKTENLVREALRAKGYYNDPRIVVEEKKSDNPKINKLLKNASKKGGGAGYPEFIISSDIHSEFLIVIECKADVTKHISKTADRYADFAVDGSLLYGSFLAKEYDVIAIGVSGENLNELRVSHHLLLKGTNKHYAMPWDELLSLEQYYDNIADSEYKLSQDLNNLVTYTRTLNELLHGKQIQESDRALLIGGILVGLRNNAFRTGYMKHESAKSLVDNLYSTICTELEQSDISAANVDKLKLIFAFVKSNTSLTDEIEGKRFTEGLISSIDREINSFMQTHKCFDALSRFYMEFLRYANADKALGIVLTPPHITELFVELAEVNKDSIVFDNCCGTGGFLISAMKKMVQEARVDKTKEKEIKEKQLVGIEYQPHIYALLISNMIIHRDGKTSMYPGDCFKESGEVKQKYSPTIGLLNPPYKTKGTPTEELKFVLNNLDTLKEGGRCVALVPTSCVNQTKGIAKELKRRILQHHSLEAVMSLPEQLFHGQTSVVTCAVVITAHKPHPVGKKTWFGYWRDDGFVLMRHKGRTDVNHTWANTRSNWVNAFRNRDVIDQFSLAKEVTEEDEWCAEAYMETNSIDTSNQIFVETTLEYLSFLALNGDFKRLNNFVNDKYQGTALSLSNVRWNAFSIGELFNVERGSKVGAKQHKLSKGTMVISANTSDNGFSHFLEQKPTYNGNLITLGNTGQASVGIAFYQPYPFIPTNNVHVLIPQGDFLNQYTGMFVVSAFKQERYKFSFGRVLGEDRARKSKINLPANKEDDPDWQFMENYIKSLPYSSDS
jgi:type I restriction enzyme M protein